MDNQDNVWIDRQEYERLKAQEAALQAQVQPVVIGSGPTLDTPAVGTSVASNDSISGLTIATGIFAIISFIFPPAVIVFLALGIASLVRFFRGKASGKTKTGVGVALLVGGGLLLIVAGPFLLMIAIVIMWMLGCWTGLASCTTG